MDDTETRFRAIERHVGALDMVVSGVFAAMVRDGSLKRSHLDTVARVFDEQARTASAEGRRADDGAIADLAKTILAMAGAPEFTADLRLVHDADRDPPPGERR